MAEQNPRKRTKKHESNRRVYIISRVYLSPLVTRSFIQAPLQCPKPCENLNPHGVIQERYKKVQNHGQQLQRQHHLQSVVQRSERNDNCIQSRALLSGLCLTRVATILFIQFFLPP